ncbi:hypothetical protein [Methylobacterium sp. SyP6R]|uniref:hypothetical protein n=1 Tax=Methylobacterium sp. SyP6R TaxID=2718876 RepID=UPI001F2BB04A|nr:hypothetical protein [Methylobacterium sp. SyP6R]MCF4123818.1 hypothetical protein [Methylobacterium sp. SyP6R]
MLSAIKRCIARLEQRDRGRLRGVHRYSDEELDGLIAWHQDLDPGRADLDQAREEWALDLMRREGLIR